MKIRLQVLASRCTFEQFYYNVTADVNIFKADGGGEISRHT